MRPGHPRSDPAVVAAVAADTAVAEEAEEEDVEVAAAVVMVEVAAVVIGAEKNWSKSRRGEAAAEVKWTFRRVSAPPERLS